MARPLRFVYPGAVYHIMARGNGGKRLFISKEDNEDFIFRLGEVCFSHGWKIHSFVLMGNHFHLLLETPVPNLVSGMKLLLGSFAQAWNRRYKKRGHVFQGRFKSVPVAGERASGAAQFRVVADYIHLNPARAKLAGGAKGELASFPWSSLPAYKKGKGPDWLVFERVLQGFELDSGSRGRFAYVDYLEKRATEKKGKLSAVAMKALKRGWYLGDESFKNKLLNLVKKSTAAKKGSISGAPVKAFGESEAEALIIKGLEMMDLDEEMQNLSDLPKGDSRKVALASLVRMRTSVGNSWLAERLAMGQSGSVSRLIKSGLDDEETKNWKRKLTEM